MELQKQLYNKLEKIQNLLSDKNKLGNFNNELLELQKKANSINDFMELRKISYRIEKIKLIIHQTKLFEYL
jgi:hypothetical protein